MADRMERERWSAVRKLVEDALEQPGGRAAQEAFLVERAGGDHELLREARSLLALDDDSAFTPPSASQVAAAAREGAARDAQALCGASVGPYRLERVLGSGGMGVVYQARRASADFEQIVAIKLVKRGMDTDEVVRRFQRERALLATLQHRGIARLYDGGSTDDGRPWLAMELVDGRPLDAWCDERRASTDQRLALFVEACQAVAFAHRNMVVHRDLKPSNILVDASGAPKLLDFGLAKLLHGDALEHGELTQQGERAMTPAYASPEQLRGEALSTATDVYSLGLVLYELLCGARAFENPGSTLERAPPRRLSSRVTANAAERRGSDERRLRRQLVGDLETICASALADAPSSRYPTVDALAADVERYRRGLPIEARPASALYRLKKFAGRHRFGVAAAGLALLSLVTGLAVSVSAYRSAEVARAAEQAERERAELREREAQQEAERANAALGIVREIFETAGSPNEANTDVTLRELLDEFDRRWSGRESLPPAVEAAVRATLGNAYVAAGMEAKGKPHLERAIELSAHSDNTLLELRAKTALVRVLLTEASYAEALALADSVERGLDANAQLEHAALADLRFNLALRRAQIHAQRGEFEPALRSCEAALATARATQPTDVDAQVAALAALGQIALKAAQTARAENVLREALALHAKTQRPDTSSVAAIRHELGGVLLTLGRDEEAQRELEAALDLRRRLYGPRHTATGESLGQLGRAHSEQRQYALALPMLEEALAIALEQMPRTHPNVATAMSRLADCRRASRDREGALPLYREALEIRRAVYGEVHPVVARSHGNLGLCLQELKQYEEAEQQLRTAIEQRRSMAGEETALATNLQTLGLVREARGFSQERVELEREALSLLRAGLPTSADTLAWALARHAVHLQERGRNAESVPAAEEALRLREQLHGLEHPRTARALSDFGSALMFNREFKRGAEVLTLAVEQLRSCEPRDHSDLGLTLERLASALHQDGRSTESLPLWKEALESTQIALGATNSRTQRVRTRFAEVLRRCGRADEAAALEAQHK